MQPNQPPIKRKNQSPLRVIVNQWGCLLALVMLGLGMAMGLLGAIFVAPQLLGFDLTATALMEREIVLVATNVELDARAQDALSQSTAFALDVQATQAILNNEEDLLAQTATQSSQNIRATATAVVVQNVQRQTEVANDFVATQAALNANATQVELDFRNTQTALGIDVPTQAVQESQSAIATPSARYTFDFTQFDLETNTLWQINNASQWSSSSDGLVADSAEAILVEATSQILSDYNFTNTYTITAEINPAVAMTADYWIIFALADQTGLAAYIHTETLTISEVGVYQLTSDQLNSPLSTDDLSVLRRNPANVTLNSRTDISVMIDNRAVTVLVDGNTLLQTQGIPVPIGGIGVQLPQEASLRTISVSDN